ncbi:hypothetical protein [Clostridium sp. CF011]|nr:hypothetical protein [Clostridium sp. CF011]
MGDIMESDIIIYNKTPTTFEEQIKILKNRNLIINDENSVFVK